VPPCSRASDRRQPPGRRADRRVLVRTAVVAFIDAYRNSDAAPEPDAVCQGTGEPVVVAPNA
jgi:hypothetical protein